MDSEPMCRACLSESGDAVPIFSSAETSGVQMPLSDMMMACSSVQVMSGDGLPSLICLECLRSLLIAFEFKLKCEKTDAMLREYIENNLVPMQVNGTAYNKTMTVDSGTLVPIATTGTPTATEVKSMVGANEIISAIPTIAINNANAIYSNANPYIIPMVECDVLVKEEQDGLDGKIFHKTTEGGNIMLKKMTVDSQANLTPVNTTVDMTTFSPRLISSEMIQPSPSQITIYGPEFRDLIRVSEDQTTLVMPKLEAIQAVNTMAQCNVLTTNSYTIDQNQCSTIIHNNVINATNTTQSTTTNNNFISTMTIPSNVAFTVKENTTRKRTVQAITSNCITKITTGTKTDNDILHQQQHQHQHQHQHQQQQQQQQQRRENQENCQINEHHMNNNQQSQTNEREQPSLNNNKKQKTFHHKKKNVCSVVNNTHARVNKKDMNKNNNNNQQQINVENSKRCHEQNNLVKLNSSDTEIDTNKTIKDNKVYYHPNQGYIR